MLGPVIYHLIISKGINCKAALMFAFFAGKNVFLRHSDPKAF